MKCCGEEPMVIEFRGEQTKRLLYAVAMCETCRQAGHIAKSVKQAMRSWNLGERRRTVLFMPEGTILGHVGRCLAVAEKLDPAKFDIEFAASGDAARWITGNEIDA